MRKMPPLAALRAFEAAARHASLKKAAEELFVSPTAISHQIRKLETLIGLPLFVRETRRVRLTPAAMTLLPVLSQSFDAIEGVFGKLAHQPDDDCLNLTSTPSFIGQFLVPRLQALKEDMPELTLRFHAGDTPVDLSAQGMHVAIRYGTGVYPGCVSRHLYTESFVPMCSPRCNIRELARMLRAPLLHVEWRYDTQLAPTWQRWAATHELVLPPSSAQTIFNDDTHLIQAVLAGQGVGLLSRFLLDRELKAGLLEVPVDMPLAGRSFYFVYPENTGRRAQLEALREWITNEIAMIQM